MTCLQAGRYRQRRLRPLRCGSCLSHAFRGWQDVKAPRVEVSGDIFHQVGHLCRRRVVQLQRVSASWSLFEAKRRKLYLCLWSFGGMGRYRPCLCAFE